LAKLMNCAAEHALRRALSSKLMAQLATVLRESVMLKIPPDALDLPLKRP